MAEKIRWGILSTGHIAGRFAEGLQLVDDAELVAVGSRTAEAAEAFGQRFNVPHRHGSYEELAADPDVDVIYIGTPHNFHHDNTLLCLEHGKGVLCEKAFAMNAAEAEAMVQMAQSKNLFLMEAMWTRYLPLHVRLREVLQSGVIGEVRLVQVDFGINRPFDPSHRLFAPELGGGALLDIGIYPVSFVSFVYGSQPEQINSLAHIGSTGVDEWATMQFGYPGDRMATLWASTRLQTPSEAWIMGTEGQIRVHSRWHSGGTMTVTRHGSEPETIHLPIDQNGYRYEAAEVGRCLRAGLIESPVMPLAETVDILRTLDRIQQRWQPTTPTP